jgi:hypothetical protein
MTNLKDLEGSHRDLIEVLSQNLPGDTEKTAKHLIQHAWCLGLDSNQASPKHKSRALPLHQIVRAVQMVPHWILLKTAEGSDFESR